MFQLNRISDEEIRRIADELPNLETSPLAGLGVMDADLFEADGKQIKSLLRLYGTIVKKYGGEETLLAQKIFSFIEPFVAEPMDSEIYRLAQLKVIVLVVEVRKVKAGAKF